MHSFVVSADASFVFFISDSTQLIKWLVNDSEITAIIDLSDALSGLIDEGTLTNQSVNL